MGVHVHAHVALIVARHGVGGQRDDRNVRPRLPACSNAPHRLATIHHGHVDVHQHEIEGFTGQALQRLGAITHLDQCHAERLHEHPHNLAVHCVVISQQDAIVGDFGGITIDARLPVVSR